MGRNAHSIRVDESNRFVFVPDARHATQIFQFTFDAHSGRLASNTPSVALMKPSIGPRHFVISSDNKFVYALSELMATVTTFSLDAKTGLLTEVSVASGLPADSKLVPGAPRGAVGAPGGPPPRNTDNDIWAADIHMTPNGKFLYITERTSSTLGAFARRRGDRQARLPREHAHREAAARVRDRPEGTVPDRSGEKSDTISVYRDRPGQRALSLLRQYPAGKGANWVEIVSFD